MTIRRAPRPQRGFTIISNDVLRDARLSYRARGVLAAILSRPDNWRTSAIDLAHEGREGRESILTALKELEATGYLVRTKRQDEKGRWVSETVIYDTPQTVGAPEADCASTGVGKPGSGFPGPGRPDAIRSTDKKKREEQRAGSITQVEIAGEPGNEALAREIALEAWKPLAREHKSAQGLASVVRALTAALDGGWDRAELERAVRTVASSGRVIADFRLNDARSGQGEYKPKRGAIKADAHRTAADYRVPF